MIVSGGIVSCQENYVSKPYQISRAVSFYVFGNIGRVMAYKTAKNLLNN
jgi:hypothetical protein